MIAGEGATVNETHPNGQPSKSLFSASLPVQIGLAVINSALSFQSSASTPVQFASQEKRHDTQTRQASTCVTVPVHE
jgi:hypothetical protein